MLKGPQPNGAHQRRKFTLNIFERFTKSRKITNFGRSVYGLTGPSLRLCFCLNSTHSIDRPIHSFPAIFWKSAIIFRIKLNEKSWNQKNYLAIFLLTFFHQHFFKINYQKRKRKSTCSVNNGTINEWILSD
jgi:hypothetical protein